MRNKMKDEKRKICLVIPSLHAGGMERVMSELAQYFVSKNQFRIDIVLYGITQEVFYPIPPQITIHKPSFKFNNRIRIISTLKTFWFLRFSVLKLKPHTLLSFGEYWNSFVLLALFGLSTPVYISDRCQPNKNLGLFHDILRKIIYPRATGIIAQTEKAKKIYTNRFRHKNIKIIGNPIPNLSSGRNIEKGDIVLTVGRLIKSKHHAELIKLFIDIAKPGWKLVIVGYDHLKQNNSERLKEIIELNGADEYVILAGKQSDVATYYLKSKIFAFTSSSEGFPNVIGEAMSAGLPVIAFDCIAGPSDMIINNKTGFLIPLFDFKQFRAKLELLMSDSTLRENFGASAKSKINEFSVDKIGDQYLDFILN